MKRVIVPLRGVGCDGHFEKKHQYIEVIVPLRGVGCDGKGAQAQSLVLVEPYQIRGFLRTVYHILRWM